MVERSESTKRSYRQLSWSVQKKAWEDTSEFFSCQLRKVIFKTLSVKTVDLSSPLFIQASKYYPLLWCIREGQKGGCTPIVQHGKCTICKMPNIVPDDQKQTKPPRTQPRILYWEQWGSLQAGVATRIENTFMTISALIPHHLFNPSSEM